MSSPTNQTTRNDCFVVSSGSYSVCQTTFMAGLQLCHWFHKLRQPRFDVARAPPQQPCVWKHQPRRHRLWFTPHILLDSVGCTTEPLRKVVKGQKSLRSHRMLYAGPFMDTTSDRLRLLVPVAGNSCLQLTSIAPWFKRRPSIPKNIQGERLKTPDTRLAGQRLASPLSSTEHQRTCFHCPVKSAT